MHHGSLQLETFADSPSMTMFRLTLPVKLPESIKQTEEEAITQTVPQKIEFVHDESRPTILIVEDNKEMAVFIADEVNQLYNVEIAGNGAEAITLLKKRSIQLIISDVMMPHMDGYAFCRAVKDDVQCCHIPFILLTAKNSSESRSGAYEAGADSFIAKPFDIDVLHSRIRQLLEQRERRLASFRKGTHINPKEITITSLDEKLIQKALECIEKNMDNTEYNVEALSADMGLERSSLYRKMQAIAGQTPTEFMRSIRLKRAARLLESGQYSVQEISWMVGFNTPRYFSSYFKEMFGMTPSAYAARNRKQA